MNCISLWQPWASAIAVGLKTIETRSWPAPKSAYGPIAIAAAKRDTPDLRAWWIEHVRHNSEHSIAFHRAGLDEWHQLPFGKVVAIATLAACISTNDDPAALTTLTPINTDEFWGDFSPGRFAWFLTDIHPLASPVPIVGRQGIFHWDPVDAIPA